MIVQMKGSKLAGVGVGPRPEGQRETVRLAIAVESVSQCCWVMRGMLTEGVPIDAKLNHALGVALARKAGERGKEEKYSVPAHGLPEAGEQECNVGHERSGTGDTHQLLVTTRMDEQRRDACRGQEDVKPKIQRAGQASVDYHVLDHADHEGGQEKSEKPTVMLVIIRPKVDLLIGNLLREHHGCHQVQGSRLRKNSRERRERPFPHVAQAKHRPPHLHVDKEQHYSPKQWEPIGADAIAMSDDPPKGRQDLGEPETDNDGKEDRQ